MNDIFFEKLELPVIEKVEYPENYIDFLRYDMALKQNDEKYMSSIIGCDDE